MKAIQVRTDEGRRTALLVDTGRKYHRVILMDNPIRVRKLPLAAERTFTDLEYHGKPYPLPRAKRLFRDAVRRFHGSMREVSKEVREALS